MQKHLLFCSVLLSFSVLYTMEPYEQDEQPGMAAKVAGCLCVGPIATYARRLFHTVIPGCARGEREYVALERVVIDDVELGLDVPAYTLERDTKPSCSVRRRR